MCIRDRYWSMLAQNDEDKLRKRLLNASDRERNSAKKKQAAELKKAEKRKAEAVSYTHLDVYKRQLRHYGVDVSDKGISKWEKGVSHS